MGMLHEDFVIGRIVMLRDDYGAAVKAEFISEDVENLKFNIKILDILQYEFSENIVHADSSYIINTIMPALGKIFNSGLINTTLSIPVSSFNQNELVVHTWNDSFLVWKE